MAELALPSGSGKAVVAVIHHDGKSTVRTIGPFEDKHAAAEYAESMAQDNSYLRIRHLIEP